MHIHYIQWVLLTPLRNRAFKTPTLNWVKITNDLCVGISPEAIELKSLSDGQNMHMAWL